MSPAADSAMLEILPQQRRRRLDAALDRADLSVPHKTGATGLGAHGVRAVQAAVAGRRMRVHETECRHALVAVDNEAQVALGKVGALVVGAWPKAEAAK